MASPIRLPPQNGNHETRTTNYEINREEQQIVANVGDLRRLTVAVIIDGRTKRPKARGPLCPASPEELERSAATGFQRCGTQCVSAVTLEVSSAPVQRPEPPHEPNFAEMLADYAERLGKPPC